MELLQSTHLDLDMFRIGKYGELESLLRHRLDNKKWKTYLRFSTKLKIEILKKLAMQINYK